MDQYSLDDSADVLRLKSAWEGTLKRLSPEIPRTWFDRFIKPLHPVGSDGGIVTIAAPGKFVQEWVQSKYLPKLQIMLSDELGESVTIDLLTEVRERSAVTMPASAVALTQVDEAK